MRGPLGRHHGDFLSFVDFLAVMALVIGLLIMREQVPFLLHGIASRSWMEVPGRVIESQALRSPIPSGEGRGKWYPNGVRLTYEYTIQGERFLGGNPRGVVTCPVYPMPSFGRAGTQ